MVLTEIPAPGQRWASNTEPDLGLGLVRDVEGRRVHLFFPAAGEARTYARENAPITRVRYHPGDTIRTEAGEALQVSSVLEEDGCLLYDALDSAGGQRQVHEGELDSFVRVRRPQDRLLAGLVDSNTRFVLRLDTRTFWARHQGSSALGLLGPRIALLPHQLYIGAEVGDRVRPRVLLADEVGLGKTIESGLIVHRRLLRGLARRVLIVVPDHLVHQWLVEMRRRFNLAFALFDEARLDALEEAGDSGPFESEQLVIAPLRALVDRPGSGAAACAADWDILVIDEAHHLESGEAEYRLVEALAARVPGLVLLTATPERSGSHGHFERLRLLDPERYFDEAAFRDREAEYRVLGDLVQALDTYARRQEPGTSDLLPSSLRQRLLDVLGPDGLSERPDEVDLASLREALLDRHGTGRALFRNTRAGVGGFPGRALVAHPLEAPAEYATGCLAGTTGSVLEIEASLADLLRPERWLGEAWWTVDPRVAWLAELLRARRGEKVLVIAALAGTARALEEHLRVQQGARTALFHEGMTIVARDRAAAYFTGEGADSAQVLVASEIGSEGRNFQQAHELVLFDLPFDPDLLEQRIGRLDRIGQGSEVRVHVPYYRAGPAGVLLRFYDEGLGLFDAPRAGAAEVWRRHRAVIARRLMAAASRFASGAPADEGAEGEIARLHEDARRTEQALHEGRERLVEANSFRPARAEAIVASVAGATHELELMSYLERVCDELGIEMERHSQQTVVLAPGAHASFERFPGLPEEGMTATFSRTEALAREDIAFLTWEHPFVLGAMDLVLHGELGNTAVSTLQLPSVKPGVLLLEAVFVLECSGPAELQLARFIGSSLVRVLVDEKGQDLSAVLSARQMGQIARRVPHGTAARIVREMRPRIVRLLERAEQQVVPRERSLVEAARAEAARVLGAELERLEALARVNPNIAPQEIDLLRTRGARTEAALAAGGLALDALRLAVTV